MNRTTVLLRRGLAGVLALATVASLSALPTLGQTLAAFSGRVVDTDGISPRSGVVVALVDTSTQSTIRSAPTGAEGAFVLESVPAGSYALLAETDQGAYLAASSMELAAGENPPVALRLQTSPAGTVPSLAPAQGSSSKGGWPTWAKWTVAGGIIVLGLVAFAQVTEDEETPASSF